MHAILFLNILDIGVEYNDRLVFLGMKFLEGTILNPHDGQLISYWKEKYCW